MPLGRIELADGAWVLGFQCAPYSAASSTAITHHGG
ncbi:allophanate hydrolase-related protein [Streptomyces sp. Tue6028]